MQDILTSDGQLQEKTIYPNKNYCYFIIYLKTMYEDYVYYVKERRGDNVF